MQQIRLQFEQQSKDAKAVDPTGFPIVADERGLDLAFSILDAYRIKINHTYNKLTSLSNSRTRLLPHQIEATHRVAGSLRPRFILADEVGLGKTIEAGLIIKELMLRRGYKRALVSVPAPLQEQWRQEMKNKFNEDFVIMSRANFEEISSAWNRYTKVITSIDFVKNPKYADAVLKVRWDIAVFDEAHRLRRDYSKTTKSYAFAEKMSERSEAFLLLSATPFRGKLEELFYLVRLVDPHLFGPQQSFLQEYVLPNQDESGERNLGDLKDRISRIMVRRRKVEVGGFTKRFACTIRFELTPEERIFYDEMTDYVRREYNLAMEKKNRAVGFVMIVFQKLLDSSTRALLRALEKRKITLEQRLHGSRAALGLTHSTGAFLKGNPFLTEEGLPIEEGTSRRSDLETESVEDWLDEKEEPEDFLEEIDELDEHDQFNNIKDLRKEILTVSHLIHLGRSIRIDRKLAKLKETVQKLKKQGHPKFIIFTQFRSTQEYLAENLSEFKITLFHGSLSLDQKEDAVREFKNETEIFISTEAGGEGRNLQFANVLINYDLPWSPLKVEQRIGRIHRFGQESDVYIFNFSTRDTVAERILQVLEEKIRLFEESIGESDPLLGAVEDDTNFQQLLMNFVSGRKSKADFDAELDSKIKIAQNGYGKLNELVTPQLVDFNLDDYYAFTQEERSIENEEIERITLSYLETRGDRRFGLEKNQKEANQFILLDYETEKNLPATFRSEIALEKDRLEFLAAGHPLVERALDFFLKHQERNTLHVMNAPTGVRSGLYFVFILHYKNGFNRAELVSCLIPDDLSVDPLVPEELLFEPGIHGKGWMVENVKPDVDGEFLRSSYDRALIKLEETARARAVDLKKKLHSIFKKEEYKLEISYFKKIRQLEEKRDRQRMRVKLDPKVEHRSALTRTENELAKIRGEMDQALEKIRHEADIETSLELLQIYRFV